MSVYIKGMEMPKSCNLCPFEFIGDCLLNRDIICSYEPATRSSDCPLVPVPEHGRLGDLDALEAKCTDENGSYFSYEAAIIGEAVSSAPTIIPADKEVEE